ncbi:hypothetical protein BDI4_120039 [Burkholderia diffusa]|nr:hypothetical protein BDI4_120039 [Burkholderia diffusa]
MLNSTQRDAVGEAFSLDAMRHARMHAINRNPERASDAAVRRVPRRLSDESRAGRRAP